MQRGDHALDRVVEQDRAHADRARRTRSGACRAEERLVLPDRLALVVEDRPATADPARGDVYGRLRLIALPRAERPRLGLDLLLDLAAEAIGIAEADLHFSSGGRGPSLTCVSRAIVAAKAGSHWVGSSGWACWVRRKQSRS